MQFLQIISTFLIRLFDLYRLFAFRIALGFHLIQFIPIMSRFELLLTSSPHEGIDLWDLRTGSHLRSLSLPSSGSFTLLSSSHLFLPLSTSPPSSIIYSFLPSFSATAPSTSTSTSSSSSFSFSFLTRSIHTESFTSVAASPDGHYIAGGNSKGEVKIWEVKSGEMKRKIEGGHYKEVSVLFWTKCRQFLVTGGGDGMIQVYLVAEVIRGSNMNSSTSSSSLFPSSSSTLTPYHTFSHHSLPITSLASPYSGSSSTYLLSASFDHTIKIYNLVNKVMVFEVYVPVVIITMEVEAGMKEIWLGGQDGQLWNFEFGKTETESKQSSSTTSSANLQSNRQSNSSSISASFSSSFLPSSSSSLLSLPGHSRSILSLSLSFDCSLLVSSSLDGTIRVWDTVNKICIRTLKQNHRTGYKQIMILQNQIAVGNVIGSGAGGEKIGDGGSGKIGGGGGKKNSTLFPPLQRHIRPSPSSPLDEILTIRPHRSLKRSFFSISPSLSFNDPLSFVREKLSVPLSARDRGNDEGKGEKGSLELWSELAQQHQPNLGESLSGAERGNANSVVAFNVLDELEMLRMKNRKLEKEADQWEKVNQKMYQFCLQKILREQEEKEKSSKTSSKSSD